MEDDNDVVVDSRSITAVCYIKQTIAVACYDELSNTIFAEAIAVSFEEIEDVLSRIKMSISPSLFVIHPTMLSNKVLMDILLSGADGTPEAYR